MAEVKEHVDCIDEDFEDEVNLTEAIVRSLLAPNASFDDVSDRMSKTKERYFLSKRAAEQTFGKI